MAVKDKPVRRVGLFVNNTRFYILLFSVILSIFSASYLRLNVSSDQLFIIRIQQVFGFTALGFWYLALIATPLSKLFGKEGFMRQYLYSRRALGVSAAYFATLHVLIAFFGQLGGFDKVGLLPERFQQSLIMGLIGLIFLLIMAGTSFDKVISFLTFPRWKWIHRIGYIAAILVFLHVWMIGTHLTYDWIRYALFAALVLLAGLESWRMTLELKKRTSEVTGMVQIILFISLFSAFSIGIANLPRVTGSYHEAHDGGSEH